MPVSSIRSRSCAEVPWRKWEPPAFMAMTVLDDGAMRLTALKSSFITCAP